MKKKIEINKKNHIGARVDDKTFDRIRAVAVAKKISMSEALCGFVNGVPDTVQEDIRALHLENNAIRQEVRELTLLLRDFIPQLITRGEIFSENEAMAIVIKATRDMVSVVKTAVLTAKR